MGLGLKSCNASISPFQLQNPYIISNIFDIILLKNRSLYHKVYNYMIYIYNISTYIIFRHEIYSPSGVLKTTNKHKLDAGKREESFQCLKLTHHFFKFFLTEFFTEVCSNKKFKWKIMWNKFLSANGIPLGTKSIGKV